MSHRGPRGARERVPAGTAKHRAFPFDVARATLANGLEVFTIPTDSPGIAAHYLVVRTGSRNEVEPGLSGFAHLFEHMMFRGTERFSAERYNDVLKRLGADSNAFTADDWTCYHVTAASPALGTVMDLESDRFMNLRYTVEAFEKETGAVLGEYNKSISMPLVSLHEKLRETAFERHTYRHTTMGFLRDIEAMPGRYAYSLEFFERWYRPDNCALVVAGDVEPGRVLDLANRFYGPWRPGAAVLDVPHEPPQAEERRAHVEWKSPTLPYLVLAWRVPAFAPDSVDDRSLDVLAAVAFSETSPLYKSLVLERQWVEALRAGQEDHRDPYLFEVTARIKDATRMAAVQSAFDGAVAALAADPPAPERVAAVKSNLRYSFLASLDTPDRVAETAAYYYQLTGDVGAIEATWAALERVTPESVSTAARRLASARRTVITLSHERART